jgi:hypothetical protein
MLQLSPCALLSLVLYPYDSGLSTSQVASSSASLHLWALYLTGPGWSAGPHAATAASSAPLATLRQLCRLTIILLTVTWTNVKRPVYF